MTELDALEENYYDMLGVPQETDDQGITEAYWRLANPYGDRTSLDPGAGDALEKLNRAYSVLGSPVLRLEYDRQHGFRGPRLVPLTRPSHREVVTASTWREQPIATAKQSNEFSLAASFPAPPGLTWRFLWLPVSWTLLMAMAWGIVVSLLYAYGQLSPDIVFSSGQVFTGLAGIGAVVVALAGIAKQLEPARAADLLHLDLPPQAATPPASIRSAGDAEAHPVPSLPDPEQETAEVQAQDIDWRAVPARPEDTDSAIADDPLPTECVTAATTSAELFHAYCEAEDDLRRESEHFVRVSEPVWDAEAAAHLRDLKTRADECWEAWLSANPAGEPGLQAPPERVSAGESAW